MEPGPEGARESRLPDGRGVDLFDFVDFLQEGFGRLYVVDLDGLDRNRPQLDYLQEITKDTDVWVDAGVPDADSVIDIVVAGARRAVVSTGRFSGPDELDRALALTGELVVEVEIDPHGAARAAPAWGAAVEPIAARVRAAGIPEVILSPPESGIDWNVVSRIASAGPVWIGGAFEPEWKGPLATSGASGGLFPAHREIDRFASSRH
jgi:hypothetical protein